MRAIRVCVVGLTGIVFASFLCVYLGAAESQPNTAKPSDLEKRVATLEDKVAQLEKRLDQLTNAALLAVPPAATAPQPLLRDAPRLPAPSDIPSTLPPSAVPREFNGRTYYIVPLGKQAVR
jgi:outer membrane murein-binding lipoprotein Lpp